jgi:hypothetical protein
VDRCVAPVDRNGISLEVELWLTAFSSAGKLSPSSSFNSAGVDQGGEQRGAIAATVKDQQDDVRQGKIESVGLNSAIRDRGCGMI